MTNSLKFTLMSFAVGIAMSTTAIAADSSSPANIGPYLGIGAGLNMPLDAQTRFYGPTTPVYVPERFGFGTGPNVVGSYGYKWQGGFRAELELGFRKADVNKLNGLAANGSQSIFGAMGNALYDFKTGFGITPYVGVGLGVGDDKWRNVNAPPAAPNFNSSDTNAQWQAIIGASMPIGRQTSLFIDYRYVEMFSNKFHGVPAGSTISHDNDRSNNILIGLRFFLNPPPAAIAVASSSPPPPAPVRTYSPPPPAPPAVPLAPAARESFLVFFDFDKSNVRPDAQQILQRAADYIKNNGRIVIRVTGYTDTMGSSAYNLALSERRAVSVKKALIKLGIPEGEIETSWKGKSDLLVPTADSVREPQNRRAEILFN